MTNLDRHAANQTRPGGVDSVDFYIRNGHRLHARAAREGLTLVLRLLRDLVRR